MNQCNVLSSVATRGSSLPYAHGPLSIALVAFQHTLYGPNLSTTCALLCCMQDYKDDNHKPEMALSLEDFEALVGFVSPAELKQALKDHHELYSCVGEAAASAFLQATDDNIKPVSAWLVSCLLANTLICKTVTSCSWRCAVPLFIPSVCWPHLGPLVAGKHIYVYLCIACRMRTAVAVYPRSVHRCSMTGLASRHAEWRI